MSKRQRNKQTIEEEKAYSLITDGASKRWASRDTASQGEKRHRLALLSWFKIKGQGSSSGTPEADLTVQYGD